MYQLVQNFTNFLHNSSDCSTEGDLSTAYLLLNFNAFGLRFFLATAAGIADAAGDTSEFSRSIPSTENRTASEG